MELFVIHLKPDSKIFYRYGKKTIIDTAQKLKFFCEDLFSKCEQIPRKLLICSHLLKKSSMHKSSLQMFEK